MDQISAARLQGPLKVSLSGAFAWRPLSKKPGQHSAAYCPKDNPRRGWRQQSFSEDEQQAGYRLEHHVAHLRRAEAKRAARDGQPKSFPEDWAECDPILGCKKTAIAFNRRDLLQAVDSAPESAAAADVDPDPLHAGDADAADLVARSVLGVMREGDIALPKVSAAFGLNARTFQRRLADIGVRYSDLLDEFRYRQAIHGLRETDISITDLALELGYEHRPNFTRAFKKRVGVSPRAYRKSLKK